MAKINIAGSSATPPATRPAATPEAPPTRDPDSPRYGTAISRASALADRLSMASNEEEAAIALGADIIGTILKVEGISDIQVRTDRQIRIHTHHGVELVQGLDQRLQEKHVAGIALALWRSRSGVRSSSAEESKKEDDAFRDRLTTDRVVDFSCEGGNVLTSMLPTGRLRVQAFLDQSGIGVTVRVLRDRIPSLDSLAFDEAVAAKMQELIQRRSGICLVTGQTGAGKSTTLAALIAWLKDNHPRHIVTIEEPIEFRFPDTDQEGRPCPSLVTQQEVGIHVTSFQQGLVTALRKRPHLIMIGEIRDRTTMETALEAALTGHIVCGTLHTRSAPETLARIIDMFPQERHRAILNQLAESLLFVLSQGLLPGQSGAGPVLCYEFFRNHNTQTRAAIRKFAENQTLLRERLVDAGNIAWDLNLDRLMKSGLISQETVEASQLLEKEKEN